MLDIDVGFGDTTPVFTVPEGHYFFMGDNRDNSQDSRFSQAVGGVGFVPADYLIGRADRIMFSADWPFEDLQQACDWFDNASIADADRLKIGRTNAARLFAFDTDCGKH